MSVKIRKALVELLENIHKLTASVEDLGCDTPRTSAVVNLCDDRTNLREYGEKLKEDKPNPHAYSKDFTRLMLNVDQGDIVDIEGRVDHMHYDKGRFFWTKCNTPIPFQGLVDETIRYRLLEDSEREAFKSKTSKPHTTVMTRPQFFRHKANATHIWSCTCWYTSKAEFFKDNPDVLVFGVWEKRIFPPANKDWESRE